VQAQAQLKPAKESLDGRDIVVELTDPHDAISVLKFSPVHENVGYATYGPPMLAAATWGGTISLWALNPSQSPLSSHPPVHATPKAQQQTGGPILGLSWQVDGLALLIAHSNHTIMKWDLTTNQITKVGSHDAPVKEVTSFEQHGTSIVVSGGWDAKVKFWTWSTPLTLHLIGEVYVAMPVHYLTCQFPLLVTAHQDRFIHIWNLNTIFTNSSFDPIDIIESPLRFETTAITCFGDGKGFAIGSIEGRCSI